MSFTDFFIKKPVLAIVINLIILVTGLLAYSSLNLREYPKVTSPVYSVRVDYPNASAEVMERQVATPLEDALGGISGMDEITSKSQYGRTEITLKFKSGTNMSSAQAGIRDGLALSRGDLPDDVKEPIVEQKEGDAEPFMYLSLTSEQANNSELTHVANIYLKNPMKTIPGVSKVIVFGQPYQMQISLDNAKLLQHGLDAYQVYNVLGQYGASLPGGQYQEAFPITIDMNITSVKEFEKIPVAHHGQAVVQLRDVADVKMGYSTDDIVGVNGKPGVLIGVIKTTDGNPLEISDTIIKELPAFQSTLPSHVKLQVDFDRTRFIRGSLKSIEATIFEAIVLVMLIVFLFLRNFRSILIPVVAIPLSLIGVMSIMGVFGLSINTITLLAMVLAVGLVVDDAIVVLENIHRHIEEGMEPKQAAIVGAREIGFAIIAMTLTLASVYAPVAFIKDAIGQIFLEFAITLAGAVLISGVVALTFSPLMCSWLLKPNEKHYLPQLDVWLDKLEAGYRSILEIVFEKKKVMGLGLLAVLMSTLYLFSSIPQALTPVEDRGVIGVWMPPMGNVSLDEFNGYIKQVEAVIASVPEVPRFLTFGGHWGCYVVSAIKPWDERKRSAAEIVGELNQKMASVPSVAAYPWSWDTGIPGVEQVSAKGAGLSVMVQTIGDYKYLNKYVDQLNKAFNDDKVHFLDGRHDLKLTSLGYKGDIDRLKMTLKGLNPTQASINLGIMMDENKWLQFKKDDIRYNISLRGKDRPFYLDEVYAINGKQEVVPFSDFMNLTLDALPKELNHYNQLRSAQLTLNRNPNISLEEAMDEVEKKMAEILPRDLRYEFVGEAKKLQESSSTMLMLTLVALFFIFCIMAIQFESFIDPLIIMFTVPLAIFGALGLLRVTGGSLDIFTQVGLITLIGLITKHGILIVEFANQRLSQGLSLIDAVVGAATLRLRPILMTTGAMVFGAIPLIMSSGAGAETRRAVGLVLVGGLSVGTLLTLFVIPLIYLTVKAKFLNNAYAVKS